MRVKRKRKWKWPEWNERVKRKWREFAIREYVKCKKTIRYIVFIAALCLPLKRKNVRGRNKWKMEVKWSWVQSIHSILIGNLFSHSHSASGQSYASLWRLLICIIATGQMKILNFSIWNKSALNFMTLNRSARKAKSTSFMTTSSKWEYTEEKRKYYTKSKIKWIRRSWKMFV